MAKPTSSARKLLDRLRSNEPASALAAELGVRDAEVLLARELVRHVGEHQAPSAGRLPDALAQAVVEAALQIEHTEFLKAVAESGSKAAVSAAKRGLAILRSRGIDVEVAPAGEAVFKAEPAHADELPCYISSPDGAGDRLLWVTRPMRGGVQLLTVLVSDVAGLLHVEAAEVSRKGLRRIKESITQPSEIALIEIPRERALGTIAAARATTKGLGIGQDALLVNLGGDPARAASPLESEPPLPEPEESERLRSGAELHAEPEARGWRPEPDAVRSLALRLDEVSTSSLMVDEGQRAAQADAEVERALATFFDATVSARYAQRLVALAEVLRATGRRRASEQALASARALKRGVAPNTIPFCRRLFEKLLPAPARRTAAPAAGPGAGLLLPES